MKVSILVPIYNVEAYIERCAISLFEQSYRNIEYIFVNDCTPDNSIHILKNIINSYVDRLSQVKIINHTINQGLAAARTTALNNATGDYIMHVDSDDFLSLDAVEKCVITAQHNKADIVVCGIKHIYEYKAEVEYPNIGNNKEEYIYNLLNRLTPVNLVAQFTRRAIILDDAYPIIGLNFGEDYVTTTRIGYYAKNITAIYEPLYNYWHGNQQSYTNNISTLQLHDILKAYEIISGFYNSKSDFALYSKALTNALYRNIVLLIILCNDNDIEFILNLNIKRERPSKIQMSFKHKIMYILYYMNCKSLMKLYKHIGIYIQRHF